MDKKNINISPSIKFTFSIYLSEGSTHTHTMVDKLYKWVISSVMLKIHVCVSSENNVI